MDSLRKEIEAELKRTRLDKGRLYELLLKIVDNSATGGAAGPAGDVGATGPYRPCWPRWPCLCVQVCLFQACSWCQEGSSQEEGCFGLNKIGIQINPVKYFKLFKWIFNKE
jgi:hypothetical protein